MKGAKKFVFLGCSVISFILMVVLFPRTADHTGMPIALSFSQILPSIIFLLAGIVLLILFLVFLIKDIKT